MIFATVVSGRQSQGPCDALASRREAAPDTRWFPSGEAVKGKLRSTRKAVEPYMLCCLNANDRVSWADVAAKLKAVARERGISGLRWVNPLRS
jgi:hypothetical protein